MAEKQGGDKKEKQHLRLLHKTATGHSRESRWKLVGRLAAGWRQVGWAVQDDWLVVWAGWVRWLVRTNRVSCLPLVPPVLGIADG